MVTIDKTGENFRLLYDVKGRFTVHRIMPEEAKVSCDTLLPGEFNSASRPASLRSRKLMYLSLPPVQVGEGEEGRTGPQGNPVLRDS